MLIKKTNFPGVLIIEPNVFKDERGYFYECWQQQHYSAAGIKETFVQDNHSVSNAKILRGLHFQQQNPLGQLIWVTKGKIFDVGVDLRPKSPTFKQWLTIELDAREHKQIYLPPGFAHGFYTFDNDTYVHYKCTDFYYPNDECGLLWCDLPIPWPNKTPIISPRDQKFATMNELIKFKRLPQAD